jgi:hypothetical protein
VRTVMVSFYMWFLCQLILHVSNAIYHNNLNGSTCEIAVLYGNLDLALLDMRIASGELTMVA